MKRTVSTMCGQFFLFSVKDDIVNYCRACKDCNQHKSPADPAKSPIFTSISTQPLEHVSIDQLMPMNLIYRCQCQLSVKVINILWSLGTTNQTALTVVRIFDNEFIFRYGPSKVVHINLGRQFEAQVIRKCEVCWTLWRRELPRFALSTTAW